MSCILLIRALTEALPLSQELRLRGLEPVCHPLFEPSFFPLPFFKEPQAFIITSKNALRALEAREDLKTIQLYVVGDQTARLAESMGFSKVASASGTSQELGELILSQAHPDNGILYHLSGEMLKGDLVKDLQNKGFRAKRQIVYSIKDVDNLPQKLIHDLLQRTMSHVMFFSPRTTFVFATLLKKCKVESETNMVTAICLSKNVAKEAQQLTWKNIWISPRPNLKNMLRYFDDER